jgi:hypothetical protein
MEMNVEKLKIMRISTGQSRLHIMIDQKQLENAKIFSYLGSMTRNDVRTAHEIQSRIAAQKQSSTGRRTPLLAN